MLKVGMTYEIDKKITENDTAAKVASGAVEVFATPLMIALMENTCFSLVQENLEDGYTTVGTTVNIRHLKASPVGSIVKCIAELTEIDGKKLNFIVKVFENDVLVGDGTHGRYIVNQKKFIENIKK